MSDVVLHRLWPVGLMLLASAWGSSCTFECNPESCRAGCCSNNVCYEGTPIGGGRLCALFDGGPGTGGGGGAGGGDGGTRTCNGAYALCSNDPCCPRDNAGTALRCQYGYCQPECGTYDDPCNSSMPCCKSDGDFLYSYVCKTERCAFCINEGKECEQRTIGTQCCPGLSCRSKPGFSTVYECQ